MPRTGPRRQSVTIRLSEAGRTEVATLAERETQGNMSWMIRKLLAEALVAREKKAARG